ncbi:MAG TPA: tetratricopeptide repeat protein [Bryobacteraceae bacterium]|nr:tetratricopeptide repeat protein [Bryobacteraceae bacterium]
MMPSAALVLLLAFQTNFAQQGLKALDARQYDAAVTDFAQAIAANPKDYSAHFNLALAYSLLGKDADAIAEYKKTLELKPDLYPAELNLGISLLREKQPGEAVPYLTAAVAEKPEEYRPNYYLASALLGAGDFARAGQVYQTVLTINPKSPEAELGLAHALVKQNRLADAAPHFHNAAQLDPNYHNDLLELATLYEAAKQSDDAIAIYRQFPDDPGALERLGELLLASGHAAESIPPLEASVAKSPTEANRAALCEAYLKNNQPGKALPVVGLILATDPNNFDIRMLHGRIIRDQRRFPEAAHEFQLATQLKPDSPQAWSELAGVLVMAEDYPAALAALDRIAALHAEKPGHVYLRAIVLDKTQQKKEALEAYRRFLAMSNGAFPDEEWKARQRAKLLEREVSK